MAGLGDELLHLEELLSRNRLIRGFLGIEGALLQRSEQLAENGSARLAPSSFQAARWTSFSIVRILIPFRSSGVFTATLLLLSWRKPFSQKPRPWMLMSWEALQQVLAGFAVEYLRRWDDP